MKYESTSPSDRWITAQIIIDSELMRIAGVTVDPRVDNKNDGKKRYRVKVESVRILSCVSKPPGRGNTPNIAPMSPKRPN